MISIVAATNRPGSKSLEISNYLKGRFEELTNEAVQVVNLQDLPADTLGTALYDNGGKNDEFNVVRDKVQKSDKLFFVIAEYNGSFPGVLKVFIDGLKFPEGIRRKKAAMIGIASGDQGASLAMSHFSDILNYLQCHVFAVKPRIPGIEKKFNGTVFTDEKLSDRIDRLVKDFSEF